jgi:hypothetical protein
MNPTPNQLHVDPVLTKISVAYSPQIYLASRIMPDVTVEKKSGIYWKYNRDMFRPSDDVRAPGAEANTVEFGLTKANYGPVVEHSLQDKVEDEIVEEYPSEFDAYQDATINIKEMLLINKERALAEYMSNTSNITQNETLSGSSQFSDYSNSNPFTKIDAAKNTIRSSIMRIPNTMIVGYAVHQALIHHPDLLERVKYSERGVLTEDLIKMLFGIQNYWVADQQYVTSDEGQTETIADIWGNHMWIGYIEPTPRRKSITFGYHFTYDKGAQVDRWYEKKVKSTFIRSSIYYVREVVANEAMFFYKNVV